MDNVAKEGHIDHIWADPTMQEIYITLTVGSGEETPKRGKK